MPSLIAFLKLDTVRQKQLLQRVSLRQLNFTTGESAHDVLLVGDRPAPSAPDDPNFHYTPFAALWNSSLWLNQLLEDADIPEQRLSWVNAANFHGEETDAAILERNWKLIVALGGNAERWIKKHGQACIKVHHPASWKRFRSKEEYPLIKILKDHVRNN